LDSTVQTEKTTIVGYGEVGGKGGTLGTRFEGAVTSLQNLQEKIVANNREIEKLNQNYDENKQQIDELTAKNEILKQAYNATYEEATTLAETVQDVSDALGEETKAYDGSSVTIGGLIDAFDRLVGWKTDATDKTTEFTNATEDEEDALQEEEGAVS
jgi:chromosome segregation ATPase